MKSPAEAAEALSDSDGEGEPSEVSEVPASDRGEPTGDEAEETTDATADEPSPAEEDPGSAGPRRRLIRRPRMRWIAAAVLVAVLAVAGYEGWLLFQQHQKDVAAAQALEAAEEFALTLTTIDPNNVDGNITAVLDGSTGEFKDLYQRSSAQLRQVLIDNKATANGLVIDAAVKSASKDRVEVVLFIDQAVSNATSPAPQLDRSRVVMTMEKVDGRWLAGKVDLP